MKVLFIKDGVSPELNKILKKAKDVSPAMKEIGNSILKREMWRAWYGSGLTSRSGELRSAIKTFFGKRSAGVSVKKPKGRNLVIPKAITHAGGRAAHTFRKKTEYKVSAHMRGGKQIDEYTRKNVGAPWGDIEARPFIPDNLSSGDQRRVLDILRRHLHVQP